LRLHFHVLVENEVHENSCSNLEFAKIAYR
jgi:hypothetical protein